MRRGPKSTPTALMELEGGKRRTGKNHREPEPDSRMPPMPEWLHPYAQAEWAFIVPHLWSMGILKIVDKAVVAGYCVAYGRWRQTEELMLRFVNAEDPTQGLMIKTAAGNVVQSPMLSVANSARRDMMRAAAELGLTPSARAQLEAEDPGDDDFGKKYNL